MFIQTAIEMVTGYFTVFEKNIFQTYKIMIHHGEWNTIGTIEIKNAKKSVKKKIDEQINKRRDN